MMKMVALSLASGGRIEIKKGGEAEAGRGRGEAESTVGRRKRRGKGIGGKRREGEAGGGAGQGPEKRRVRRDCQELVYVWWTIELYFVFHHNLILQQLLCLTEKGRRHTNSHILRQLLEFSYVAFDYSLSTVSDSPLNPSKEKFTC